MADDARILNSVRTIENTVTFKVFNYEHTVISPSQDSDLLTDIRLQMHGHPTYLETGRRAGIGFEDLRVYLDHHDVTNSVIACLRNNLDAIDQSHLKSQYKQALDNWLILGEKLGPAYPGKGIDKDRAAAERLLEIQPLSANLRRLGDKTAGWGGNLHIINFLYNQIDIPTISFKEVIEHFNDTQSELIDISNLGNAKIIFSVGPCRLFSSNWNPIHPFPEGSLTYRLEFNYFDPLLNRVASLEQRVTALENRSFELERRVTALEERASEIERRVTEVEERATKLENRVNDLEKKLSGLEVKLKSLQTEISGRLKSINSVVGDPEGQILKILKGQKDVLTGVTEPGIKERVIMLNSQLSNCEKDIKSLNEQLNSIRKNSIPDLKRSIDKIL